MYISTEDSKWWNITTNITAQLKAKYREYYRKKHLKLLKRRKIERKTEKERKIVEKESFSLINTYRINQLIAQKHKNDLRMWMKRARKRTEEKKEKVITWGHMNTHTEHMWEIHWKFSQCFERCVWKIYWNKSARLPAPMWRIVN